MTIATARMIASSLLVYPDERFLERREEFENIARKLDNSYGDPLIEFFRVTSEMSLDEIQRHYVEIFDMRRRCSLFLTSWTHGDTRNRGMALIYFKEKYRDAGIVLSDEELPDHLAVVLEFAALIDPAEGNLLLGEHRAPIELIRDALPPMTPEIEERARALALNGPPVEFVGLSGAVSIALEPYSTIPAFASNGVKI
jgi:nitrate reductase delta subunit